MAALAAALRIRALLLAALAAAACASSQPSLAGTTWQLVAIRSRDGARVVPDDPAKYTLSFGSDGFLSARVDCNRGRSTWSASGADGLKLGPLALTRAACAPASLHDRIVGDWARVGSYALRDGHLFLEAGTSSYELGPDLSGLDRA